MIGWMVATFLISSAIFLPYGELGANCDFVSMQFQAFDAEMGYNFQEYNYSTEKYSHFKMLENCAFDLLEVKEIRYYPYVYFILIRNRSTRKYHAFVVEKGQKEIIQKDIIDIRSMIAVHLPLCFDTANEIFQDRNLSREEYSQKITN